MNELPLLPVGLQTFEKLRLDNAVYVDKTGYLPGLRRLGGVIFCARPRRFGKSLTISTLDAFHSGKKDLFRGLAAEQAMDAPGFEPRPVIRLDMSIVSSGQSLDILQIRMRSMLADAAKRYDIALEGIDPVSDFTALIAEVRRSTGKQVVLLIDEYDYPVIRAVYSGDPKRLADTREFMSEFYTQIKVADRHLHFAFLTGVSKFTRMGVFSSLNNITDISMMSEYAGFMGITHTELEANFAAFIEKRAKDFGIIPEEMTRRIQRYYDGFSFDGKTKVYNPFSTLQFFNASEPVFDNFWAESGSASFVRNFLKEKRLRVDAFRDFSIGRDVIRDPGEIDAANPALFLYQAGYLTLKHADAAGFTLDYPNFEVLSSMSALAIDNLYPSVAEASRHRKDFLTALQHGDVVSIIDELRRLFARGSYEDYGRAEKRGMGESFYRSRLESFLYGAGIDVRSEVHNNLGRMDVVAEHAGRIFVFELKAAEGEAAAEKAVDAGMEQMRSRKYGNAFANPILICLAIDEEKRNIGAYRWEEDAKGSKR